MRRVVWCSLLILVGCTRGCPMDCRSGGGEPAKECSSDKDCDAPDRCRDRICKDPAWYADDDRCLATPECKTQGFCRPGLTRSFLGGTSKPTCLVERTEDCAASTRCKQFGRCELQWTTGVMKDGYCGATTAKHCADSARCASHDECVLDAEHKECVRSWDGCSGAVNPGFEPGVELGGPWQPGAVDDAILACWIEDSYEQKTSFVRITGTCVRGPILGSKTPLLMHTKLALDTRVEIAFQADPKHGTTHDSGYVRATYTGSSPFTSGTELPKLTCHVVPVEVAKANAAGMIARIEKGLVRLAKEKVYPDSLIHEPAEAGGIRRVLAGAAQWIPGDPQIAKLQAALDAQLVIWRRQLDAAIGKLAANAEGPSGSTVRIGNQVCGDKLRPRVGNSIEVGKDDCGIEVVVRATQKMQFGIGSSDLGRMTLSWMGPDAAVSDATVVDVHSTSKPSPAMSLAIEPGEEAIVLVIPRTFKPLAGAKLIGAGNKRFVVPLDR